MHSQIHSAVHRRLSILSHEYRRLQLAISYPVTESRQGIARERDREITHNTFETVLHLFCCWSSFWIDIDESREKQEEVTRYMSSLAGLDQVRRGNKAVLFNSLI